MAGGNGAPENRRPQRVRDWYGRPGGEKAGIEGVAGAGRVGGRQGRGRDVEPDGGARDGDAGKR